jgi:hypothetical protein
MTRSRALTRSALVASLLLASPLVPGAGVTAAAADDGATYETLLASKAPAVVAVKVVVQATAGGKTEESNQEARGILVDATGLVMVGNEDLEGKMGFLKTMMKAQGVELTTSPSDVKILFGSESKEHPAVLVARDSTIGLAFVQILDLEGHAVEPVDLSKGAAPAIGQAVFGITRKSRGFDCAPTIDRLVVNGKVDKPRALWSVAGTFAGTGLPVFDAEGRPVGVYSHQKGSEGVDDDASGGGLLAALSGGAGEGSALLPLDAVLKSLEAARKRIPEAVAKAKAAAAKDKDAPKDGATPDAPKGPDAPTAPDAPKGPDVPKAPDAPDAPKAPDAPNAPDAPEAPKAPETPKPEQPK